MNNIKIMNYNYPEGSELIEDEACASCGMNTLYEFPDVVYDDKRYGKSFCACEKCWNCPEDGVIEFSTPDDLCQNCFCPNCGIEWYFVLNKNLANDDIAEDIKLKCKQDHLMNCTGKKNDFFGTSYANEKYDEEDQECRMLKCKQEYSDNDNDNDNDNNNEEDESSEKNINEKNINVDI